MGLPMWKDPEDEVAESVAAKVDRIVAASRSSIRREPSIRPGRNTTSALTGNERAHARNRLQSTRRLRERILQEDRTTESQIALLEEELETLRRIRYRAHLIHDSHTDRAGREVNQSNSTDRVPPLDESTVPPTEEASNPAETVQQHLPRPSRESNLRFEVRPAASSRPSSPWRYQVLSRPSTVPSPPRSDESERIDRTVADRPVPFDGRPMPALTQGFAPARAASRVEDGPEETPRTNDEFRGLETPPPETWESSYPPLERASQLPPRQFQGVDGLGDRRRSPSPASDAQEEETWANLLATMEAGRSSLATSFASIHSDSQTGSGRMSQNTSTSFGEIGLADDTCDLDLPPGITEEDVLEMRARHRPSRDDDRMTGRRGLQEHLDRIANAGRAEVGMFRAILDRMQRREEIPDEWWATVGLSPDIGRP